MRRTIVTLLLCGIGCRASAPAHEWIDTPALPWVGEHLGRATHVEVLALDPSPFAERGGDAVFVGGWKVVGRSGVLGQQGRSTTKQLIQSAIAAGAGKLGARCFVPHHAVVAEHSGHRLEIVLCFMCSNAEYFWDGIKHDASAIGSDDAHVLDDLIAAR